MLDKIKETFETYKIPIQLLIRGFIFIAISVMWGDSLDPNNNGRGSIALALNSYCGMIFFIFFVGIAYLFWALFKAIVIWVKIINKR